jgi:hypothetical protein
VFINRKVELEQLSGLYRSDRAELFVLYGRRRVGKTELLRAFCAGKAHIFFIATLSTDSEQLANFSQQIWGLDMLKHRQALHFHPGKLPSVPWLTCLAGLWWYWTNLPILSAGTR